MVSVIVPNFNHATYLDQRIESILFQTYRNFEVIILDDASTDNSRHIIEKYRGHEKVAGIFYNEVNSGSTFRQWEKGIELSSGEYIWIAESDDWCEPTFLEELVNGLVANTCVVAYCQSYCIVDAKKIKWQSRYDYLECIEKGREFIINRMLHGNIIFNASMALWRKDVFPLVSKEYLNYRYCGDWLFWIELCRHGDVYISGKLLNYYRKHDGDVSGKAISDGMSIVEELKVLNLLYLRQWISYPQLLKSLKSEYIFYKSKDKQLAPVRRREILQLFFTNRGMETAIRIAYMKFYATHLLKKMMNMILRPGPVK